MKEVSPTASNRFSPALYSEPGALYEKLPDKKVRCFACGHRCLILNGKEGICRVRHNENGTLKVPFGYVAALQCDPIEKKPFFHALPGTQALSFGMLGCDFHCSYCQNWEISQAFRDPSASADIEPISAPELTALAVRKGARVVASTYNEPLITSEWAVAVFREAKRQGLTTAYVSNGNGTPEVLDFLRPHLDLYKIDLKSFSDEHYRQLGGNMGKILNTIERLFKMGFWLEIVTLVVPGFNDSDGELREMARFLVNISPDIPWHLTSFHQEYKMRDRENTYSRALLRAAEIGLREGMHFVYAGNLPGRVGQFENTYCPKCRELLVARRHFTVVENKLAVTGGRCPKCNYAIPGRWQ